MHELRLNLRPNWDDILSGSIITAVAIIPLFFDLPFRDNIYLSYEGSYRIFKGQRPFVDFGMPMGYTYWLLPSISFFLFGPYLFSLVKIQVLINIISGLAFHSIISHFTEDKGLKIAMTFLYVISFSFYNFWPWYNHSVIVFEVVAISFLLAGLKRDNMGFMNTMILGLSAIFTFLSLFTKQDGGAFTLLLCGILLIHDAFSHKSWHKISYFSLVFLVIALIVILPLIPYEFTYWFNYGQAPHHSRIDLSDLLNAVLGESQSIKLYFLLLILIILSKFDKHQNHFSFQFIQHLLLTIGILFQASILQVTSYVPANGNIYYHSFLLFFFIRHSKLNLQYSV